MPTTFRLLLTLFVMVSLMRAAMAQWPDAAQPSSASSPANPAAGQADFQPGTAGPVNDPNAVEAPGDAKGASQSFWEILKAGGVVGLLILLLSIVGVALAIEHLMTIRARVLMPEGLADDVRHLLAEGNMAAADERCRRQPSFLAFVLAAGLVEIEGGWSAVEKAMEDATADQSARLLRKVEYLSVIGNIAPMLGLLGTVIGMIFAFHQVADTQGAARAADLATGIYLALVTTVEGLIVAIPALGAFAVFRNRVDQLVAETAYAALHALGPLKRRAGARRAVEAAPPLPPGLPRGGRA